MARQWYRISFQRTFVGRYVAMTSDTLATGSRGGGGGGTAIAEGPIKLTPEKPLDEATNGTSGRIEAQEVRDLSRVEVLALQEQESVRRQYWLIEGDLGARLWGRVEWATLCCWVLDSRKLV